MSPVKGIGGIFIFSDDSKSLAEWYTKFLEIEFETHPDNASSFYTVFFTRDFETSAVRENPVFAINPAKDSLEKNKAAYLLNLRVDDLDSLIEKLTTMGVTVEPKRLNWERGKHAWIHDGDGNRVELYEEILVD